MARARVRPATERDLDLLIRHRRRMFEDMGYDEPAILDRFEPFYRRWARQRLRSGRLVAFIVEDPSQGAVASGCVWLQEFLPNPGRRSQRVPYLMSMYTEPKARKKGHARRIVREAIRWCRQNGHSRMFLHASSMGRGLYREFGFERTWQMRLRLLPGRPARARSRKRRPLRPAKRG